MDQGTVLKTIKSFRDALVSKGINIDRIILFGSHADKTADEDSDIDLVVISENFKDMDYWQRIDVLSDAIADVFKPIEAIGMTQEEFDNRSFMAADYARGGVVV
jgi:predicted nucleotidyltransferase